MKEIESNQQIVDAVEAGLYLIVHTSVKLCRNKQSQPRTVIVVLQSAVVPAWRTGRRNSNALQYPEMVGLYTFCCHVSKLWSCGRKARSEIIIVSPKKIIVGSTSTSDQDFSVWLMTDRFMNYFITLFFCFSAVLSKACIEKREKYCFFLSPSF